jgi:hypothetical protein
VSPIPKEPPDAGPSRRSIAVSEMIMNPLRGERVLVAQVMKQYVTAYNGRNAAAVKEVYPSFDGDVREFVDTYQLENVTIYVSADGASATVSAKERTYYNYEGKKTPTSADCTFTLKKQGDSWIILSIERRNIRV